MEVIAGKTGAGPPRAPSDRSSCLRSIGDRQSTVRQWKEAKFDGRRRTT